MLLLVDDVNVVDRFGVRLELAQAVDSLGGGQRVQDSHVFGRHQAAGRIFTIGEQFLDVLRLVFLHFLEQELGPVARHVGQQVRNLVWGHGLEDVGRPFDVEPLED